MCMSIGHNTLPFRPMLQDAHVGCACRCLCVFLICISDIIRPLFYMQIGLTTWQSLSHTYSPAHVYTYTWQHTFTAVTTLILQRACCL